MSQADKGAYLDGRRQGHWVERHPDHEGGGVLEGSYVDGKPHGNWVKRYASGQVYEGSYLNMLTHGSYHEMFKLLRARQGQ